MKKLAIALLGLATCMAQATPLENFKAIVQGCEQAINSKPSPEVAYVKEGKWVKRIFDNPKFTYDVIKTDSLVTPLIAFFEFSQLQASRSAVDEASAKALEVDFINSPSIMRFDRVNFQLGEDGKNWVVSNGTSKIDLRMPGKKYFENAGGVEALTRSKVLNGTMPLAKCLANN